MKCSYAEAIITPESRPPSYRGKNGHLLYRKWLYKAPFKSFIPHVLNLIQMGENHKFFSLVINFVQMFEPTVVHQKKKKSFLLFYSGENFSTFPRMSPPKKVSQGCGVNSQLSLYNRGKGDVDHCLNYVVFLICSYY